MAVCLERGPSGHGSDANCLEIGLVNNMPDAALEATERQFRALLEAAADGIVARLTLYGLPDVPRTEWGRHHVSSFYSGIGELLRSEEHTSELQSRPHLVCRLLLEKKT